MNTRTAAHLLADRAHASLRRRGFSDRDIRLWADAYIDHGEEVDWCCRAW